MRKKICFVVSAPVTARVFLLNHIKQLSENYEVYIVANDKKQELVHEFKGIPIGKHKHIAIRREINLFKDIVALIHLYRYFKKMKFEVVHSVSPKAGLIGMLASRLANISIRVHIFTGQVWYTKRGVQKRILKFLDSIISKLATHILVDGNSQRDFLIKEGVVKNEKSKVLGKGSIGGVDLKKFRPDVKVRSSLRQQLTIDSQTVVFMFLGRFKKDKGVFDLVNAFLKLKEVHDNCVLMFVGYDEENIQEVVKKKYGEQLNLKFLGPTKEPQLVLQLCDVFCLPSYREGFGTSMLEASATEKPVICSDTYGLKDAFIDEVSGLKYGVSNVNALYLQMKYLFENEGRRIELGRNGRTFVEDNFSDNEITNQWVNFYKELLHV